MRISPELYQQLIDHAQAEAPNECCGMIAAREGEAVRVYRARNAAEAPQYGFQIAGKELYDLTAELGDDFAAIYHSHPRTAPEPSLTDINFAQFWPGITWIIIGFVDRSPEVRAWLISGGEPMEAELQVG